LGKFAVFNRAINSSLSHEGYISVKEYRFLGGFFVLRSAEMKYFKFSVLVIINICLSYSLSLAHFGMVIPTDNMVMQDDEKKIEISLTFSHPFEMAGMPLEKPGKFFVVKDSQRSNLIEKLEESKIMDNKAWRTQYSIKRPGAYTFIMEPAPYWEPAEDCYIIHYTKTVVAAFGDDEGWDSELGIKTEIVPLSRPFGLYAGNVFQGIVKLDGKTVPFAQVEVEYFNSDKKVIAPTDYMITQSIKADQNGVFTYVAPVAGWWGFAALNRSEKKMMHDNIEKNIELGAVLWVKFEDWQEK
jgi:cobalt/nickel transport protein